MAKKKIAVIGATGSIGMQALDVIDQNKDFFDVRILTAHSNKRLLNELGRRMGAEQLIFTGEGMQALLDAIDNTELDMALVAASGTEIAVAAQKLAQKGIDLALANKESIVSAGRFLIEAANDSGCSIIPVDSEHSALFQCMKGNNKADIVKVVLTASGGAFRDTPLNEMNNAAVEDALNHPNWKMGKKITVDSATMMNKGLELIEARMLFDIEPEKLAVSVHPQSIVHSVVAYKDGSVIAQMAQPDMRIPISYALFYPDRGLSGAEQMDFETQMSLSFYPPDLDKYKCLKIAIEVLVNDRNSEMIVMNASNEVAVNAFINSDISFGDIASVVEAALEKTAMNEPNCIEDVILLDRAARAQSIEIIKNL